MPIPELLSLDGDAWSVYWLMPAEWRWRRVWEREPPEAAARRMPAVVPGTVQEDLLAAGAGSPAALPHPYQGENSRLWEWTWQRDWVYEREFVPPADWAGAAVRLRFAGIDHTGHVFLNGEPLGVTQGMFVPCEFDVTDRLRWDEANRLLVVVEHAPEQEAQIGWTSRVRHWKARFAYGWDWCTRLVPLGIWDRVSLRATGEAWLDTVAIHTHLSIDRKEAALSIVSEFGRREAASEAGDSPPGVPVVVRVEIVQGGLPVAGVEDPITVFDDTSLVQSLTLRGARLWWPNGMGEQPLYEARVSLLSRDGALLDGRGIPFGIRQVAALPNEGAPEADGPLPGALPYTLTVNGERVWARGWNWVPLDHLYGRETPERTERFLRLARDAHVNLLRVWGGGLIEKEAFYDLCDRYGIMVWQEFPQSSSGLDNRPAEGPEYLQRIEASAAAILTRRRHHPSLVLWCGGNELTDDAFRPLDDGHPALRVLQQAVATHDPQRLWLPTSPSGPRFLADPEHPGELHDVHGPWSYLGPTDHYAFYNAIDPLLHSEFGAEGPANLETLQWIAGTASLWPPDRSNPLWLHHGGAWWAQRERVEELFGPIAELPAFVRAGQWLQAEGVRYGVEANRRRQWRCSGVLPWQFNEAWPNATCTNAVDYFGRPKPVYDVVRRAYRPFHVSAAYDTIAWHDREQFRASIWLHNDGEERSLLNVAVTLADVGGQIFVQENLAAEAPAASSEPAGDVEWRRPRDYAGVAVLLLQVIDEEGEVVAENAYLHSFAPPPIFVPLWEAPLARVTLRESSGESITLANEGSSAFALDVAVAAPDGRLLTLSDNHLILPPGEQREIRVQGPPGPLVVQGWNVHP
jgi:beta-mannosidase